MAVSEYEAQTGTLVRDWLPGTRETIGFNILGGLLFFIALFGFGALSVDRDNEYSLLAMLGSIAIFTGLIVIHEAIHALAMRRYGGNPQFGLLMIGKVIPAAYCTSPGTKFTRRQYLVIALAPFVVITAVGLIALASGTLGIVFAFALALHAGGCIGDFWASVLVLREPAGTTYEDLRDGLRFTRPAQSLARETGAA